MTILAVLLNWIIFLNKKNPKKSTQNKIDLGIICSEYILSKVLFQSDLLLQFQTLYQDDSLKSIIDSGHYIKCFLGVEPNIKPTLFFEKDVEKQRNARVNNVDTSSQDRMYVLSVSNFLSLLYQTTLLIYSFKFKSLTI